MNSAEIKEEALRRIQAMDPREVEEKVTVLRKEREWFSKNHMRLLFPRKYGKMSPEECAEDARLGNKIVQIESRGDPHQRTVDNNLKEHFGLTRDDMRDGDPHRLRPYGKKLLIRWLKFLVLLAVSVILPDLLGLSGGRFGWILYSFAMSFFVLSLYAFVYLLIFLFMNRDYKKSIPKVSSPAYQEQEVQAEVEYILFDMADPAKRE